MSKDKKEPKPRSVEGAMLARNRKAFGQAGPMRDKRKEQSKRAARGKLKIEV